MIVYVSKSSLQLWVEGTEYNILIIFTSFQIHKKQNNYKELWNLFNKNKCGCHQTLIQGLWWICVNFVNYIRGLIKNKRLFWIRDTQVGTHVSHLCGQFRPLWILS